jgi:hypothetical protein
MNWPTIPENLSELSASELRELARAIKTSLQANLAECHTAEDLAEYDEWAAKREHLVALAQRSEAIASDTSDDEPEVVDDPDETDDGGDDGDDGGDEAAVTTPPIQTALGVTTTPEAITTGSRGIRASQLLATDAAPGKRPGEAFESYRELSVALMDRAGQISSGSDVKHTVATIPARFEEDRIIGENQLFNLDLFSDEEIMAAMCAPLQPLYDLACANTSRRPVANSLPAFQFAARGGFTVYPSPSLTDITTGYGQWTAANDADAEAVKVACQTIECATPVEYRIYGVYRCLTVKNLLQMTFPELVEAYLNRLAAAHARLAETLLLEAMGNASTQIDALSLGYNATTTILSTILNYLGLYQEVERWDNGAMDVWLPRWLQFAIKMDLLRRRRTDGGTNLAASDGAINAAFADVGVTPHWYMDRPSWATPIPNLATNGVLNQFPRNLEMLVAPRGKFALMDRGNLNIGVGGNIMRDNTSLSRNEFTFFFENFEGLIDTNTCPAHIIQINDLCYNGVQVDDVAVGCEGLDIVGIGS